MSQWSKINWRRIFFVNTILTLLMFTPFMPINSYLHGYVISMFTFINVLVIILLMLLIIIAPAFIILFGYLIAQQKMNTAWMMFYSLLCTFFLTFFISTSGIIQNLEGRLIISTTGRQLVDSLEGYKRDKGHYPAKLSDLLPKYIKKLPQSKIPAVNQHAFFDYKTENDTFYLSFEIISNIIESKVFVYYEGDLEQYGYEGYNLKDTQFPNWKTYSVYGGM